MSVEERERYLTFELVASLPIFSDRYTLLTEYLFRVKIVSISLQLRSGLWYHLASRQNYAPLIRDLESLGRMRPDTLIQAGDMVVLVKNAEGQSLWNLFRTKICSFGMGK